eukprot:TRINITY_DN8888_c0_g1_i10.p1 TRINITY_DN8888_c0_g1~~TRINITY_DN8888_c0_g1_i10.p1  ORF type:complete len:607 (-),score=77.73 TRINITY_DN8888_c0_g1_i10:110-1930(-)
MTPAKLCIAAPLAVVAFATALPDAESSEARQIQDADLRFQRMLAWLESGIIESGLGDDSRPSLADTVQLQRGIYGRSLVAKRSIQKGSLVAVLPLSRLISEHNYSNVQQKDLSSGMDADHWQLLQLAVALARTRRLGSSSPMAPYIELLPKSYNGLPHNWNDSDQHPPQGLACSSLFLDDVRSKTQILRSFRKPVSQIFGMSVEELSWAMDTAGSRAWGKKHIGSLLFPLFDLMNHADHPNMAMSFNDELQALQFIATRQISAREELLMPYFLKKDAWETLQTYGFVCPSSPPAVNLKVSWIQLQNAQEKIMGRKGAEMPTESTAEFELSENTSTTAAKHFLSYLRLLAEGGPTHEEVEAGGLAEDVAPSTWAAEKLALEIGSEILRDALASYKDIQVNSIEAHARNQYLKMLCESDRLALQWWLEVLQRGLRMAGTNESRADLTYLHDPWHAQLWNYVQEEFFWCWYLHRAAADAWAEHPFELLLVAFGCATLRRGFIMFVRFGILSCCRHSRTSVAGIFDNLCSLSSWWVCLGSLVALASAVSMQRSNHLFQFVLIATLALELCFNSDTLAQLLRLISIILCCSAVLASIYFAANAGADDVTIQ